MKINYEPSSTYYTIRCNETMEEHNVESQADCIEWAKKVVLTFGENMTFTITQVKEKSWEIWVDTTGDVGTVR